MRTDKELKFKEMTVNEGLQLQIINLLDTGQNHSIQNNLKKSFESFKQLLLMIDGYNYDGKEALKDLNEILTDYFDDLESGTGNRKDVIILKNKKKMEVRIVLERYQSEIIKRYCGLGLWFSVKVISDDIDIGFSDQFFNDEFSALKIKKEILKKLKGDELISYMRPNTIHEAYSSYLINKSLRG